MTAASPPWANRILKQLEIEPVDIDIAALQRVAANLHANQSDDQLVVGFLAGYAAGLAEGAEMASFERAHAASLKFMDKITAADESEDS
ncbi:MAG TPA: hypothetical protein H9884_09175 [Candidatus Yaniella excrementigallinarum]|nr:hypothetical protein [Candidatus Yaniella excrementigallinarum]